MGEVIDFATKKADILARRAGILAGEVRFRCLVCKQWWKQQPPEGMKKVNCPKCGSTLLKYKPEEV